MIVSRSSRAGAATPLALVPVAPLWSTACGGLAGARELAPGCGVFVGGAAAAAKLVASGEADADDFAFFVGCYEWAPGELSRHVAAGVHDSVACADTVTLAAARHADRAQTLWHELMFALGGRHRDVCVAELDRPAVSSR